MNSLKKLVKKIIRVVGIPFIFSDYRAFKKANAQLATPREFSLSPSDFYPCIKDKTITTGFDRHYVFHTAWAARVVKEINPKLHIDISSSLYFCSIVSAFVPVDFYDYRKAELNLTNLNSKTGNLMKLPFEDGSIESISCMHTIEHIGLGRYGDPIDPEGDLKAITELIRVTKSGGSILFVTPLGKEAKIEYNAHRIYTFNLITKYFKGLSLKQFAYIPEESSRGGIIIDAEEKNIGTDSYGCGCFWFIKK